MHSHIDRAGRPLRRDRKVPIDERFADEARFFKTWFENPGVTGAVSPSGRALARTMARYVDPSVPGPLVELGPGTGPVTQALLRRGVAPERLVLVEYEPKFCRLLERRFPGVRVIQGDAYALATTLAGHLEAPAAAVVSSLPLLNRPDHDRIRLLGEAFGLMHPDGTFVQFTYGMVSPVPRPKRDGALLFSTEASPPVWLNLPPARVFAYRAGLGAPLQPRAAELFLARFKGRAVKVREDLLENAARMEAELRMRTRLARHKLALHTSELRGRRRLKPAFVILDKNGKDHLER